MLAQYFSPAMAEAAIDRTAGPATTAPARPVVFVDRDGVINANRADHVKSWGEFEFLPGALEGLALLARHGRSVVVITNQAIVNRGLVTRADIEALHRRMVAAIAAQGGAVAGVLACPHRPEEACACRKPAPGLLQAAASRFGVSLGDTILIGDHGDDLEAARRAGARSILVLSGRVRDWPADRLPDGCVAVLPNLLGAARHIVAEEPVDEIVGHGPVGSRPEGRATGPLARPSGRLLVRPDPMVNFHQGAFRSEVRR